MRLSTIRLLIAFIRELIEVLGYQSNIFPREHLQDLANRGKELVDALNDELKR